MDSGARRRGATQSANPWRSSGLSGSHGMARESLLGYMVATWVSKLMAHRDFLQAARTEKTDVTLQALCDRLSAERGVKTDTSMMSRFFRKIGVTFKKRPSSGASRIARTSVATANDGETIRAASIPGDWCSSTRPGPRPT